MKKALFILLCFALIFSLISCDTNDENDSLGTPATALQTTASTTKNNDIGDDDPDYKDTDISTPCAHSFGEWSISKEATESADGEERRDCSLCEHFETKIIYAKGTAGLSFTLSEDEKSYSVNAGSATDGDVFIPAYHNGLPITSIGCIDLPDDFEPDSLELGEYAFLGCDKLKSVVIPSTVTDIGEMAFAACTSLESVILPSSVTVIGAGAFEFCESLESIVIPEGVELIGEAAFALTVEDLFNKYPYDDIKVSIPNTQVILVLREYQLLFGSGVEIYYLDENGNENLIANTNFSDGGFPFEKGCFEVINNGDATFSVRAGEYENKEDWTEKTFDIPQCTSVFVPKIEDGILVFYGGENAEAWNVIDITSNGNKKLLNSVIYYYSETEPNESDKFWHYVGGIPTLW